MTQSPAIVPEHVRVRSSSLSKRLVLSRLEKLSSGVVEITENGEVSRYGQGSHVASFRVLDERFWSSIVKHGPNGAAEAWVEGWWTTDHLTDVLRIFAREADVQTSLSDRAWISKWRSKFWQAARSGTVDRAKQNILAHYDLSNDFYRLWLDPSMTYSSGLFSSPEISLSQAQQAKYQRMAQIADIQDGHQVVEIGTGWGGFAVYLAENHDVEVTTTTISDAQFNYAEALIRSRGLEHRINLLRQDYREVSGTFDRLVSVEMIEAVGHEHLPSYFQAINRLLKGDGQASIQAITMPLHKYKVYLGSTDFIRRYVFPGSCCPSLAAILSAVAENSKLRLVAQDDFAEDYAITLAKWLENFCAKEDEILSLGFDDRFLRFWKYYLSYCEAGFRERSIGLSQLAFAAPENRSC